MYKGSWKFERPNNTGGTEMQVALWGRLPTRERGRHSQLEKHGLNENMVLGLFIVWMVDRTAP